MYSKLASALHLPLVRIDSLRNKDKGNEEEESAKKNKVKNYKNKNSNNVF